MEQRKKWAEENAEKRKEIARNYANKDWTCEICNKTLKISGMARHKKTLEHINKISNV